MRFWHFSTRRFVIEEAQVMRELTELVKAAQSGDSEAYDTLIQRFQQMAYATAYRYLGDHHLAQDLVQEAALEAFVHLPQLKEPGAFPGWFRQIVFRQCTRVLRQVTLQYTSLEVVSNGLLAESGPEDIAVKGEVQASVRSALASLPRHEQLAAALFYGCGYSYNEVSALLKIPLTTVKKRLHSARQKLRMQLQATLRDEIENANARPESDGADGAEICLARWWNWLTRCVKEMHASWQASWETGRPYIS
jgi:RNA polymerase sigma factor (sigma-70 family)